MNIRSIFLVMEEVSNTDDMLQFTSEVGRSCLYNLMLWFYWNLESYK